MIWPLLYTLTPVMLGGILHMAVVQFRCLQTLARPLDGGRLWRGKPIFGAHKTWRGLLVIYAATTAAVMVQAGLEGWFPSLADWNLVDYRQHSPWQVGLIWASGYALAELPNSFLKRRLQIAPGQNPSGPTRTAFLVLDQADSAFGCGLVAVCFLDWTWPQAISLILLGTALHLLLNFSLHQIGLRTRPV